MHNRSINITSLLVIIFLSGIGNHVLAQSRCDPSLPQIADNPLSYHDLGDRCEGIYIERVGGTTLRLVSLMEFFDTYDPASGKALHIRWNKPPGNAIVRLRAQSMKRKLYYRMDTYCVHDSTAFSWPTNVLASLKILKNDIGIAASTSYQLGKNEHDVYLPVRISQKSNDTAKSNYHVLLMPGEELKEVYISISKIGNDGQTEKVIKNGVRLGYGYYPADRAIDIPLEGLKETGTYSMHVGATLKNSGSASIDFWFYNPKKQN